MEELIEENKKLKEYIKVLECKNDEELEYKKIKSIIKSSYIPRNHDVYNKKFYKLNIKTMDLYEITKKYNIEFDIYGSYATFNKKFDDSDINSEEIIDKLVIDKELTFYIEKYEQHFTYEGRPAVKYTKYYIIKSNNKRDKIKIVNDLIKYIIN